MADVCFPVTVVEMEAARVIEVSVAPQPVSVTLSNTPTQVVALAQQGPAGPAGGTTTTQLINAVPQSTWILAHYLNRYPSVTLQDTSGDVVEGSVKYLNSNIIEIDFSAPVAGVAFLN